MSRTRPVVGAAFLLLGALIALGPFVSVWRVGGQALHELPDVEGADERDERTGWSAMFDDEFVLARRTFTGVDERTVTDALVANGFESTGTNGLSRECCGDYDAVLADVRSRGADHTVVELTAVDSDWQLVLPLFSGFGSLVALIGLGMLRAGRSSPRQPATAQTEN